MPRDDDSFWLSVFRKSPIIGTCMAICGLIGLGLGYYFFDAPVGQVPGRPVGRLIACLEISTCATGIFVGLIIGSVLDTIFGALRDDKKKKKRRRD